MQCTESGSPIGVRAAGGQDSPEDPLGGDADHGGRAQEADRDRGAGDRAQGEGAGGHREIASPGRELQSRAHRSGQQVNNGFDFSLDLSVPLLAVTSHWIFAIFYSVQFSETCFVFLLFKTVPSPFV